MSYETATPDDLAAAMRVALSQGGRRPRYRKINPVGAQWAAERVAGLLTG